jgi:hypothetical protein
MDTNKCWYVKTETKEIETDGMSYHEALFLAGFLIRNNHKGVTVYKGQLRLSL